MKSADPREPRKVTIIPANPKRAEPGKPANQKLRVAAYCRVSTDSEEQINSYKNQLAFYTEKINNKVDWKFAGVYADATDIIGLKQNPTNGRRFSPIFVLSGHFSA